MIRLTSSQAEVLGEIFVEAEVGDYTTGLEVAQQASGTVVVFRTRNEGPGGPERTSEFLAFVAPDGTVAL